MNEVEKMYKLANVQPQYKKRIKCKEGHSIGQPCGKCPCIDCDKSVFEDVMPPFTAEKQIQLILFILNTFEQGFNCRVEGGKINLDTLERGIAQEVINFWQDLTEEERKQIKEILE